MIFWQILFKEYNWVNSIRVDCFIFSLLMEKESARKKTSDLEFQKSGDIQQCKDYVQQLIDKHLSEDKRFSVQYFSDEEILIFMDFLTGDLELDLVLDYYNNQKKNIKKDLDELLIYLDKLKIERNLEKDVIRDLNSLKNDIMLDNSLLDVYN